LFELTKKLKGKEVRNKMIFQIVIERNES